MKKRLLSMLLTLCMIVSLLPVTAMAEEIHTPIGTSGEITSFAPLTEAEKTASLGTSIEGLDLPETLTATVRTAVPAAENPTQDSGSPQTATPTTATEPEWVENTVDIPVRWGSPGYDMNTEGEYVFTPGIKGYTVSAQLPEIKVTVGELPLDAAEMMAPLAISTPTDIAGFAALQTAINNASGELDLKLSADFTITEALNIDTGNNSNITIDLNGKTMQYTGAAGAADAVITHCGSGKLTITDRSSEQNGKVTTTAPQINTIQLLGSSLVVEGGTIENAGNDFGGAINNIWGSVEIKGGTVSCAGINGATIFNQSGILNISGGEVRANAGTAILISGNGNITIGGTALITSADTRYDFGTICMPVYNQQVDDTVLKITGGTIENTAQTNLQEAADYETTNAINNRGGYTVEISGGMINATGERGVGIRASKKDSIMILRGNSIVKGRYMAMIGLPTLSLDAQLWAGTDYERDALSYYKLTLLFPYDVSTTIFSSYKYLMFTPTIAVAAIGTKFYKDLQDVFTMGASGSTIVLLVDNALRETVFNEKGKNFTLDLNGKTLSCPSGSVLFNAWGNLTVTDNSAAKDGVIDGDIKNGAGTLTIAGGTVRDRGSNGAVISSSERSGPIVISGGTVSASGAGSYAIQNKSQHPVRVSGDAVISSKLWWAISGKQGVVIEGGWPVIKGGDRALNTGAAPSFNSAKVTVTASTSYEGTPTTPYYANEMYSYKYLAFSPPPVENDNDQGSPPPVENDNDQPNSPTQGEIKVPGTVDGNGNNTVSITDKTFAEALDKALAEAKKNGNEQNGITVILRVDTGSKTGSNVTVNLPKTVQDTIIAKKIVNTIVVVDNPDIRIGMDLATVQEINKQAKSDVNITATRGDSSKLTGDAKKAIGSRPVFDLKVNYGNGKAVSSFGAGSVSVTIPYTLGANEKAGNVQAVYVDANGKVHWLTNSVYDSVEKVLRFSTSHFSTYGIGYKQANTAFTDIAGHWAKEDIEFVVSRGLFSGTSNTTFSPNTAMTRGMFVTALGRLANADVSGYTKSSFTDVKNDAYDMGYIEWASKNNIVNGIGNGKFAPDQSITREQMAVIMTGYAKAIGYTLPKVHIENTFADNSKISTYAKEAVKQMQMAGVISGKNGNLFDPQGTATRAEVSAVLRRFVELAISSDTAQGWSMNDSGKWMYFKDGKPITGKQDIDGATYTFDQYGVTADVPKNLRYTTYTVQKGDSFWSISRKLNCTMAELERLNNKSRFSLIHPGDVLRVPEE